MKYHDMELLAMLWFVGQWELANLDIHLDNEYWDYGRHYQIAV